MNDCQDCTWPCARKRCGICCAVEAGRRWRGRQPLAETMGTFRIFYSDHARWAWWLRHRRGMLTRGLNIKGIRP